MKTNKFGYRIFFGLMLMLWIAVLGQSLLAADSLKWFRGQLHSHTYLSDGRGFPEQAIEAYKQRGYQFLAISDHNRFAADTNLWREVAATEGAWPPKVLQAIYDSYVQTFGQEWVEGKTNGPTRTVRLKTYAELKARFEEPGSFILLPGVELTQILNDADVHLNYINLPVVLPSMGPNVIRKINDPAMTVSNLLARNAAEVRQAATELQQPYLLILNHPFWRYYSIAPQNLLDCAAIRFFEVCNNGTVLAPPAQASAYSLEKFWDVVNAFRRSQGQPLLFGIGSDDAHFYDATRINGESGVGDAWIMVRAAALTPEQLIAAMQAGDFYATCGVLLEELAFTPEDKTLRLKVLAEPGVKYTINFIATKRDFDRKVSRIESPAAKDQPARSIPIYADDIGRVVKTVAGTKAEYRLTADDLYVRARVESDIPSKITPYFHPKTKMAWTQPYAVNDD